MPKRLHIPTQLLTLNPTLNLKEIRAIVNVIWNSRKNRVRQAYILDINLPNLGRFKSRGNKRYKRKKKRLKKDVKRKREQARQKELTRDNLLW